MTKTMKKTKTKNGNTISILTILTTFLIFLGMDILFVQRVTKEVDILWEIPGICGFGLHFVVDGFRSIYGLIAAFMWFMVSLLSQEYFKHRENVGRFYLFLLLTEAATLGVFLSADLMTTFIFFEIMSFTSYVWVAQEENTPSLKAAETYLAVAVTGGLVMLMGIFILYYELGTLTIEKLLAAYQYCDNKQIIFVAGLCILFGFGAKAGAFPLHIWLPKAHPVAPAPASALLSGILTKTGIYGILILSCNLFLYDKTWGMLILVLGVLTMFGGALLAVFSVDLKRTLACSSMSQIGFILVGIGMQGLLGEENALAVHGTFLHMANHSLIKLLLFMAAGVIYMNTHVLDLNKIRGFGRKKPLFMGIFLVGALAIGGIPFFSGYISKTLLHESIVEYGAGAVFKLVESIFLFSGGLTIAYMTKLFVAIFIEKNEDDKLQKKYDENRSYMNLGSKLALLLSALVLLVWGLFPYKMMDRAAEFTQSFMRLWSFGEEVNYFSVENLKGAFISITIGAIVYFGFIRTLLYSKKEGYKNLWPKWLDMENLLYRPVLLSLLPFLFGVLCRLLDSFVDTIVVLLRKTIMKDSPIPTERVEGSFISDTIGKIANGLQAVGNRLWNRKNKKHKNYVHIMAMQQEDFKENTFLIQRSLSFGLLMFCIGLGFVLIYIILL